MGIVLRVNILEGRIKTLVVGGVHHAMVSPLHPQVQETGDGKLYKIHS